jgi:hypothetical protein
VGSDQQDPGTLGRFEGDDDPERTREVPDAQVINGGRAA